jgi:serine/threonine protein kinase
MTAAFFESDPPKEMHTPVGLRAPEQIFGDPVDKTADIWAFGILVFEMLCGTMLYQLWSRKNPDITDDEHILMLIDTVGPLPERFYNRWTRSSKYFTPEGVQYNRYVDNPDQPIYPDYLPELMGGKMELVEDLFIELKPKSFSSEEATLVKALIRRTLQYDPAKRPTASELLQDPWFTTEFESANAEEVFSSVTGAFHPTDRNRRST